MGMVIILCVCVLICVLVCVYMYMHATTVTLTGGYMYIQSVAEVLCLFAEWNCSLLNVVGNITSRALQTHGVYCTQPFFGLCCIEQIELLHRAVLQ